MVKGGIREKINEGLDKFLSATRRVKWLPLLLLLAASIMLYAVNDELREMIVGFLVFASGSALIIKGIAG